MKTRMIVALALGVAAAAAFGVAQAQTQAAWGTLVNGTKGLENWVPVGNANWRVMEDGIGANQGGGHLVTKESYRDFRIVAEVWVDDRHNSGIFIRCQDPAKVGAATCYEVNIFDTRPDQTYRTGGIVDVAKPTAMINTGNKWNSLEIVAKGPRLIVRMNGMQTVDVEDKKFARGPFALQAGVGVVRFRNVQIRELK